MHLEKQVQSNRENGYVASEKYKSKKPKPIRASVSRVAARARRMRGFTMLLPPQGRAFLRRGRGHPYCQTIRRIFTVTAQTLGGES